MFNRAVVALLLSLGSGAVAAQERCNVPDPTTDVQARRYAVDLAAGPILANDPVHCPDAVAACARAGGELLVDEVLGVFTTGEHACVLFVLPDDPWQMPYRTGYLPLSLLTPMPAGEIDWSGTWSGRSTSYSATTIVLSSGEAGTVHIEGSAGNTDKTDYNVSRNLYREDLISEDVVPRKYTLEFEQTEDDIAAPYQGEFEGCKVRMWRAGPYLLVSDNPYCGAPDVSFSGLYTEQ